MKPTQPAPRGAGRSEARASLACEDRRLVGCVRASNSVAEVGGRRRGSEKRDFSWQGGAWTGAQALWRSQELRGAAKTSITGTVVAKPRRRGRPEPGVRKGIAGRRSSQDGRHPGPSLGSLVHAGGLEDGLGGSRESHHARAWCVSERGDRGVRGGHACIVTGRKRPPRWTSRKASLCKPAEVSRAVVQQATSSTTLARERST